MGLRVGFQVAIMYTDGRNWKRLYRLVVDFAAF
jgi:hypothetical protein